MGSPWPVLDPWVEQRAWPRGMAYALGYQLVWDSNPVYVGARCPRRVLGAPCAFLSDHVGLCIPLTQVDDRFDTILEIHRVRSVAQIYHDLGFGDLVEDLDEELSDVSHTAGLPDPP